MGLHSPSLARPQLSAASTLWPSVTRVLTKFHAEVSPFPTFPFTSIRIWRSREHPVHRDLDHGTLHGLITACGEYRGGQLWVECATGSITLPTPEGPVRGTALDVFQKWLLFPSRDIRHAVLPIRLPIRPWLSPAGDLPSAVSGSSLGNHYALTFFITRCFTNAWEGDRLAIRGLGFPEFPSDEWQDLPLHPWNYLGAGLPVTGSRTFSETPYRHGNLRWG